MQTLEAIRVLQTALRENRPPDENVLDSMGVLQERLEQIRMKSVVFENVAFSEEVERLARRSAAVVVN